MPEVVVKGERQFQVTAERRDLLLTDPMAGAKEMPLSVTEVAMPGFDAGKDAPVPETVAAKNLIFMLEAGLGPARLAEGRLVLGQEFDRWNYSLRMDYDAGEDPAAFGFQPFAQSGSAGLDLRGEIGSGTELTVSLNGQGDTRSQPQGVAGGWGDWLERGSAGASLRASGSPWSKAALALEVGTGVLREQGAPAADPGAARSAHLLSLRADYAQTLERMLPGTLQILLGYGVQTQGVTAAGPADAPSAWEALRTLQAGLKWRPVPTLTAGVGIRLSEYQGQAAQSAADITGEAAWVLPTRTVLYATADPELNWQPAVGWVFQTPYPTAAAWLAPEHVYNAYRLGWRQNFGDLLSTDLAWFTRDAVDTQVWRPAPGAPGLFDLTGLSKTHLRGLEAQLDLHYSNVLDQTFRVTVQQPTAPDGSVWPGIPTNSGYTELKWHVPGWELAVTYRYLGERYADTTETSPSLGAAHLLGARADLALDRSWDLFGRVENCLGYNWSEWLGYPARGISALAGVRVNF